MGKLLLITWTFSYTKATPFIWMANFQSLFIKKRLVSFCTSLFVSFLSISSTPSRILFWGERYVRYNLEEKIFKKLRSRFLLSLRNNGIKKYIHTKLFQHVTYSQRDKLLNTELPLPNVCEPLISQEAERRIFLEGEATFSLSQGDEATSSPRFNSPHLQQRFPQHNQQQLQHNHPRGHEDFRPPLSEHFN